MGRFGWLRRHRRLIIVVLALFGVVALACAGYVGFRYYRFAVACRRVADAPGLAERLADPRVCRDVRAHAEYLESRLKQSRLRDILAGRLDREVRELYKAARGKFAEPYRRPGHHVIVTVSAVDGAEMPASVSVPDGWNGTDPLPLVLVLHGGGVHDVSRAFPVRGHPGVLCAAPLARGSHDYMGVQWTAVEECLADLRRRYPVSSVFVVGSSMGGLGAWLFGLRHVADVGGISPWMANADPDVWKGLWEPEVEPCSPAGRANALVQRARMPVARVAQLASRPDLTIYVGHGASDDIVPVGHSDSMVEKLRKLGAACLRYDRFDGLGHGVLPVSRDQQIAWLLKHKPAAKPGQVTAAIPPLTFVADLADAPPHRVVDPLKEAKLVLRDGAVAGGENVEAAATAGPSKWHYPGPAGAAFEHAFSIDLPPGAPGHLRLCAADLAAMRAERYRCSTRRSDRGEGFAIFPRRANPRELRTLIALGSPTENPAVKAALSGLDVRVAPRKVRLFGRDFAGEDIGLIVLRPQPADPHAATLVVWGSTATSYRQLWRRFGEKVHLEGGRGYWWFDYAVYDRKTCGPDTFLAVGFFDHAWRFDPKLLSEGSAKLRADTPGAAWATARESGRGWLSALPPDSILSRRGPVGFDRSAGVDAGPLMIQGQRFGRGLSTVPPATVRWRLGGRFATLKAKVGIERTGTTFKARYEAERVRFEVWGDGRLLAQSPVLSATSGLADLTVDVRGVDRLELRAAHTTAYIWHYGPAGWGDAELLDGGSQSRAPRLKAP